LTATGTVEVGKEADLLVVDGDPLEDITVLKQVHLVVRKGRIVKGAQ
jgi:imidazolonepropionase-like amidohydrolase